MSDSVRLINVQKSGQLFFRLAVFSVLLTVTIPFMAHATGSGIFESITVLDGLSHNMVNAIVQDNDGMMWFGTRNGVNVYDGYTFTTYTSIPGEPGTLTDNNVDAMFKDSRGDIWIGTFRGLNRIDHTTREITQYTGAGNDTTTLSNRHVTVICEDVTGDVWFGTEMGLNRFHTQTGMFTQILNGKDTPEGTTRNFIRALMPDPSGKIWVGSQYSLSLFDPADGTFTEYLPSFNVTGMPRGRSVVGIQPFDDDRLLVTFEMGGVVLFNTKTMLFEPFPLLEQAVIRFGIVQFIRVFVDSSETYWFGTRQGLLRYNRTEGWVRLYERDITAPYSICNRVVSAILEDRSGILWFGTWGGIAKLNPAWEQFTHYSATSVSPLPLSGNDVFSVCDDLRGNTWIGTVNGLNCIDHETGELIAYDHPGNPDLAAKLITMIGCDSAGDLWVGTQFSDERTLTHIDREGTVKATFDYIPEDSTTISGNNLSSFFEDSKGYLWFGTHGSGLSRYNPLDNTFSRYDTTWEYENTIAGNWISSIVEDAQGCLWIGTDYGLLCMSEDREQSKRYINDKDNPASISSDRIRAICLDSSDRFWVGTENGLNLFDPEAGIFTSYFESDGLASSAIFFIFEGSDGNLWMSTSQGVSRFNPQTGQFRNYNNNDGLRNVEFTYGTGYWSETTNTMYFGGWNGLIAFNPQELTESEIIPPVVITSLRVLTQQGPTERFNHPGSEISLNYRENFFAFEFAVLDYAAPDENTFLYMLEGLDNEWVYNGTTRVASYTDVPPGKYTFHIRGANSNGVWNNAGTAVSLIIVPPFWMTTWFRILLGITFVGLLVFWYRMQVRSLNLQRIVLNEKVRERTRAFEEKNRALIESEQRFKRMFTQSSSGFILTDANGQMLDINDAGRSIFGTDENESRVYPNIFVDPFLPMKELNTLTQGRPVRFDVAYDFDDERIQTVFSSKHHGIHTLDVVASPLGMTDQGNPSQYLFQITDTTEKKLMEEQLLIRERMDFLGNLSAGIAHDFNNLLVGIMGNLDLLRIGAGELSEEQTEYLESALQACKRASGLIQDFQSLSTGPIAERTNIDLHQIVKDVFGILERTTDRLIEKQILFEPDTFIMNARPDQLHQVFMNLGMNAAAAIQDKGVVPGDAIAVRAEKLTTLPFEGKQVDGEFVHITFRDTGTGMTDEVKRRAFDPLFTTKARGVHKGQGLGLAMVYSIITRNHDGFIEIESSPGRGTAIHMYLPEGMKVVHKQEPLNERIPTGSETVLIVEDEDAVRNVTRTFLETQGYHVITAQDGWEGLEQYLKAWEHIDLVLLDLTMPRLSGEVVCSRMLEVNPEARIIISSGHSSEIQTQFEHASAFLGKPYQMNELAQTVRTVLDTS